MDSDLDALVTAILGTPKYRGVCPALVRRLGARELAIRRNTKEAAKATRSALHQAVGAYLDGRPAWDEVLDELGRAADGGAERLREKCRCVMGLHASTRERLPVLDRFYAEVLAGLPPIHSIVDIGCGLNPLSIPWMPLAAGAAYVAVDACADICAFLTGFFPLTEVRGEATPADICDSPPDGDFDLALVLKVLPVVEQSGRGAGMRILHAIRARHMLVSFPTRSLGGRGKGMAENYEAQFLAAIRHESWTVTRHSFREELCFLINTTAEREPTPEASI